MDRGSANMIGVFHDTLPVGCLGLSIHFMGRAGEDATLRCSEQLGSMYDSGTATEVNELIMGSVRVARWRVPEFHTSQC